MRVRMRVAMSGTRDGVPWPAPGGTVDLPDAEARKLLGAGMAETATAPDPEVTEPPEAETTAVAEAESRPAEPTKRPRGRPRKTAG